MRKKLIERKRREERTSRSASGIPRRSSAAGVFQQSPVPIEPPRYETAGKSVLRLLMLERLPKSSRLGIAPTIIATVEKGKVRAVDQRNLSYRRVCQEIFQLEKFIGADEAVRPKAFIPHTFGTK